MDMKLILTTSFCRRRRRGIKLKLISETNKVKRRIIINKKLLK
jgi:hypothetical protein